LYSIVYAGTADALRQKGDTAAAMHGDSVAKAVQKEMRKRQ
jgi:hypothetical protein